jgi:hypothetical protein
MSTDANTIQAVPQSETSTASDELELKSVGTAGLVVVYHRNAYGTPKAA